MRNKNNYLLLSDKVSPFDINQDDGLIFSTETSKPSDPDDPENIQTDRNIQTPLEELLYKIYDFSIRQDRTSAREKFNYLQENNELCQEKMEPDTFHLYQVVKLKYYLLINDKKLYEPTYKQIMLLPTSLNSMNNYIKQKTLGIFYYRTDNYLQSSLSLNNAHSIVNTLSLISDEDIAELYYQIALTKIQTNDIFESIYFAEKALVIYKSQMNQIRAAECHIILGINNNYSKRFEMAEMHYISAKKIGESLNDKYLESMALNNLGKIKSRLNQSEEAILNFLESLKLKNYEERSVYSISGLVEEYYYLKQFEFSKEWAEQGLRLAQRYNNKEYIFHFTTHMYLLEKNSKIETYLKEQVLPYFIKAGNERFTLKYTEMLAEYYYDNLEYKLASEYYQEILRNMKMKFH
ncbi:tetratricopeptide repeat protein [Sutcliffiella rhizosphaerae]|uniref:Tetratricopeptide repeat protein n=1 Tax=Sutcliffiella rhizosphaerae TaxID=2880967 RepID=A0ABN8AEB9_9BACI|nr:tetratricopeptide repeat protein [Sutcliffiella rhizosphaerae]CAG9622661.1 hypothetical protein BACCIP111883_03452 [Sutcliffiella rhizosphaerae]